MPSPTQFCLDLPRQAWQVAANLYMAQQVTMPGLLENGNAVSLGLECKPNDIISLLISADEAFSLVDPHAATWHCAITSLPEVQGETGVQSLITDQTEPGAVDAFTQRLVDALEDLQVKKEEAAYDSVLDSSDPAGDVDPVVEASDSGVDAFVPVIDVSDDHKDKLSHTGGDTVANKFMRLSSVDTVTSSPSATDTCVSSTTSDPLLKHRRVCKLCGQAFYMATSLMRHVSSKHRLSSLQYRKAEEKVDVDHLMKEHGKVKVQVRNRRRKSTLHNQYSGSLSLEVKTVIVQKEVEEKNNSDFSEGRYTNDNKTTRENDSLTRIIKESSDVCDIKSNPDNSCGDSDSLAKSCKSPGSYVNQSCDSSLEPACDPDTDPSSNNKPTLTNETEASPGKLPPLADGTSSHRMRTRGNRVRVDFSGRKKNLKTDSLDVVIKPGAALKTHITEEISLEESIPDKDKSPELPNGKVPVRRSRRRSVRCISEMSDCILTKASVQSKAEDKGTVNDSTNVPIKTEPVSLHSLPVEAGKSAKLNRLISVPSVSKNNESDDDWTPSSAHKSPTFSKKQCSRKSGKVELESIKQPLTRAAASPDNVINDTKKSSVNIEEVENVNNKTLPKRKRKPRVKLEEEDLSEELEQIEEEPVQKRKRQANANYQTDKKTYDCSLCQRKYLVLPSLLYHVKTDHKNHPEQAAALMKLELERQGNYTKKTSFSIICPICQETVVGRGILKHIKKWHGDHTDFEESYRACNSQINSKLYEKRKASVRHQTKMQCEYCGQQFKNSVTMRRHSTYVCRKNEQRSRIYHCSVCGWSSADGELMEMHKASHPPGQKNFTCAHCGVSYMNRAGLYMHMKTKHPEQLKTPVKKCACEICGKEFINMCHVRRHMITHSDVHNYQCHLCGKGFKTRDQTQRHVDLKHLDRYPYRCELCGNGVQNLKTHECGHIKKKKRGKMWAKRQTDINVGIPKIEERLLPDSDQVPVSELDHVPSIPSPITQIEPQPNGVPSMSEPHHGTSSHAPTTQGMIQTDYVTSISSTITQQPDPTIPSRAMIQTLSGSVVMVSDGQVVSGDTRLSDHQYEEALSHGDGDHLPSSTHHLDTVHNDELHYSNNKDNISAGKSLGSTDSLLLASGDSCGLDNTVQDKVTNDEEPVVNLMSVEETASVEHIEAADVGETECVGDAACVGDTRTMYAVQDNPEKQVITLEVPAGTDLNNTEDQVITLELPAGTDLSGQDEQVITLEVPAGTDLSRQHEMIQLELPDGTPIRLVSYPQEPDTYVTEDALNDGIGQSGEENN